MHLVALTFGFLYFDNCKRSLPQYAAQKNMIISKQDVNFEKNVSFLKSSCCNMPTNAMDMNVNV